MVDGRWTRPRVAVLLVAAVAVVSIVTGVANIATPGRVDGPLAGVLPPEVVAAAGFTGALTGFVLLVAATGMRRGLRAAWRTAVVLLPVTLLQGLVQSSTLSAPLVVLSAVALPSVLATHDRFDRRLSVSGTGAAVAAALATVQLYGTAGTYALRDGFTDVETVLDAFYYTLVTASTVGYGDAAPTSQTARLFAMSLVVLGTASFGIAAGTLIAPLLETRLSEVLGLVTETDVLVEGHVLVLGYGDLTEPILTELDELDAPFLVVTADRGAADRLGDRGIRRYVGDPSDEATLDAANVDAARAVVVATDDDADDALAILTARHLAPDARIVAAATDRENVPKLRRAGADTVVSPAELGGHLLVRSALGDEGMEAVADRVLGEGEG